MRYSKTTAHAIVIGKCRVRRNRHDGSIYRARNFKYADTFKDNGGQSISQGYHENHNQ